MSKVFVVKIYKTKAISPAAYPMAKQYLRNLEVRVVELGSKTSRSKYTVGNLDDLMGVLSTNYHLVLPDILSSSRFNAIVCPAENSATFVRRAGQSLLIMSPVGKSGMALSIYEISRRLQQGILIGITESQKEELSSRAEQLGLTWGIKDEFITHFYFVDNFDISLQGPRYGHFRRAVGKSIRDGLEFGRVTQDDAAALRGLFNSWLDFMHQRKKTVIALKYLTEIVRHYFEMPFTEAYGVRDIEGNLLAAGFIGITGITAIGKVKLVAPNKSQASEYLDYRIMELLKDRNVKFYDQGYENIKELANNKGLIEYKLRSNALEERLYDLRYVISRK